MKKLRRKIDRFFITNRNKGIPNLMLWVAVGNLVVFFVDMMDDTRTLYSLLMFNASAIFHGQVWRLFSFIFTYLLDTSGFNFALGLISLFVYYQLGKALESQWGRLRFNAYYVLGVLIQDVLVMVLALLHPMLGALASFSVSTTYVNLSLFLAYATLYPETRFLLFFIIPIKAKWFALVHLLMIALQMINTLYTAVSYGMGIIALWALYPLISLLNYWLFLGNEIPNLLPASWRINAKRLGKKRSAKARPTAYGGTGGFSSTSAKPAGPYMHKCTVCGRTDTDNPDLEFRYCSRCSGYRCYCIDHINNHIHIH